MKIPRANNYMTCLSDFLLKNICGQYKGILSGAVKLIIHVWSGAVYCFSVFVDEGTHSKSHRFTLVTLPRLPLRLTIDYTNLHWTSFVRLKLHCALWSNDRSSIYHGSLSGEATDASLSSKVHIEKNFAKLCLVKQCRRLNVPILQSAVQKDQCLILGATSQPNAIEECDEATTTRTFLPTWPYKHENIFTWF